MQSLPKKISTKKNVSTGCTEEDGSTGKQSAGKKINNIRVEAKKLQQLKWRI